MRISHSLTISPLLILLLTLLSSLTLAARSSATSFCKCICFTNSTIIALNPQTTSSAPHTPAPTSHDKGQGHALSCTDCTRAFCLSYNLPICASASENDVFTTCFQRDSIKDETVVVLFIFATMGLLGWAVVRPWVERLREGRYLPLGRGGSGGGGVGVER
jgi:hypothetical protein